MMRRMRKRSYRMSALEVRFLLVVAGLMGSSVVAAVVGKLLWAMRRPTVVFMVAVGVVVVLVGVMAVACTPPADTDSGTTPSGDTGSGNTGSGNTGAAAAQAPFKEYLALV